MQDIKIERGGAGVVSEFDNGKEGLYSRWSD
jgi:hypothetical protein